MRIEQVWVVIDFGVAANPNGVKAQIGGCTVMALGAAVMHEVHFDASRAVALDFNACDAALAARRTAVRRTPELRRRATGTCKSAVSRRGPAGGS